MCVIYIHVGDKGKGFLIVYAIDKPNSFLYAKELKQKIADARYDDAPFAVVLVGNKCDLDTVGKRQVPKASGMALSKQWNCPFLECSAKEQINNAKCFQALVREIRRIYKYDDSEKKKGKKGGFSFCTIL